MGSAVPDCRPALDGLVLHGWRELVTEVLDAELVNALRSIHDIGLFSDLSHDCAAIGLKNSLAIIASVTIATSDSGWSLSKSRVECTLREDEFERHFVRLTPRLAGFVQRYLPDPLRNQLDATDILQEVWMAAHRHCRSFHSRGDDALFAWLATITRSKIIEAVRRKNRDKRSGGHLMEPLSGKDAVRNLLRLASSDLRTPSGTARVTETRMLLQIAIDELAPNRRRALMLRYVDECETAEIARLMDTTESAVRSLIANGIKDLRRILGPKSNYLADDL